NLMQSELSTQQALDKAKTSLNTLINYQLAQLNPAIADKESAMHGRLNQIQNVDKKGVELKFYTAETFAEQQGFQREAWKYFQVHNKQNDFSEANKGEGKLSFALAWRVQSECMQCHAKVSTVSSHHWEAGEVAGIFTAVVNKPIVNAKNNDVIRSTLTVYGVVLFCGFICVIIFILKQKQNNDKLIRLTATDPLTGLYNKNELFVSLNRETEKVKRGGKAMCLISFDVDGFKQINDTVGHIKADEILRDIGDLLPGLLRAFDIPCRFVGDEFCIILPGCSIKDAKSIGERIIESLHKQHPEVNLSMGIAQSATEKAESAVALLDHANANRDKAKATEGSSIYCQF
ncbi:MAG: diguanylate cyclase, partial [Gammaproteobacteria bacterium]|nr:diguanylate cyclase [Gammaproteobacteria bacterium]